MVIKMFDLNEIKGAAQEAALELILKAKLKFEHIVIVGCSSSEIVGQRVGTHSSPEIGVAVFETLNEVFSKEGIYLAAQCCEHLNRAVIIERVASTNFNIVNAVPVPNAGGAFAAAAYSGFSQPVALESVEADAGLDIGGTLIGMHLKRVAIPLRLETASIGKALLMAARTRPPLVGGKRAHYDEGLF
ncbi:MAG: TIGR01440 family protein [Oscillospiraceae bacterium]|nr:TIGR01440 family protein [Oscillospiraceae bacterium]